MNSWLVLMKDYSHGIGDSDWCPYGGWDSLDEELQWSWAHTEDSFKVDIVLKQASFEEKHGHTMALLHVFEDGSILKRAIP